MNIDAFLELAKTRRSIRRFKSDPVPDELILKILEAARWAQSGGNSQPWEFIVIRFFACVSQQPGDGGVIQTGGDVGGSPFFHQFRQRYSIVFCGASIFRGPEGVFTTALATLGHVSQDFLTAFRFFFH